MPKIYDNIENNLVVGLNNTLSVSYRSDFCVGYFNLRGWKQVADENDKTLTEHFGFTEEELDFIISYDIKYRMGKELKGED